MKSTHYNALGFFKIYSVIFIMFIFFALLSCLAASCLGTWHGQGLGTLTAQCQPNYVFRCFRFRVFLLIQFVKSLLGLMASNEISPIVKSLNSFSFGF